MVGLRDLQEVGVSAGADFGNGLLKPAYSLQHGVDYEYITWLDVTQRATDTRTLIPFLKDMEDHLPFRYRDIVADAGYESEETICIVIENTNPPAMLGRME